MSADRREVVGAAVFTLLLIGCLTLFQVYTYHQVRFLRSALSQAVAERKLEYEQQQRAHEQTHGLLQRILDAIRQAPAHRAADPDDDWEGGDL